MWQADGEKDCVLTRGGLTGRRKPVVTTNCEKSAEAIVPVHREGLNNLISGVAGERRMVQ